MLRLLIIIICVLTSKVEGNSRIIGGDDVQLSFGKFHASLQNLEGDHVCGGAVISHKHIVTAAHCVVGAEVKYVKVIVGTTNLNNGGLYYDVESIYVHDNFNTTIRLHDIAVIKIKEFFDLKHVDIIQLSGKKLAEGDVVLVSGFGAEKPKGETNNVLQSLIVPVFNQETCRYALRYAHRKVYDSNFCTFSKIGEGTCNGDSGGPLIKDKQLVGLVSWGIPCGSGFPDVHTRINVYVDWIMRVIKGTNTNYCKVPSILK